MSVVHRCTLPQKDTCALPKLAPNASYITKLARAMRKLIILNPQNYRCKALLKHRSAIMQEQLRHIKSNYSYIIHPFSILGVTLRIIFFAVWLVRMLYVPVMSSMCQNLHLTNSFDLTCTHFVQPLIILAFFFMGYVDQDNTIVIEHRKIAVRYVKTYFFFDLATTEVLDLLLRYLIVNFVQDEGMRWRITKVTYFGESWCLCARLFSILRYLEALGQMLRVKFKVRRCVVYTLKTFMSLHLFACSMYFIPQMLYHNDWPGDSWIALANIQPDGPAAYSSIYGECFLMATCYFFGASPRWQNVNQTNEQVFLSLVAFFGRLYTLYLLADILQLFGIVGISECNYEKQRMKINEYMVQNNLPGTMRSRMVEYYEHKLLKRYFNETEILDSLSDRLRAEIFLFSSKKMVQKATMFQHLPPIDMAELVSMMQLVTFGPGDVVVKPHRPAANIYFISSGCIGVYTADGHEMLHLEDGEMFGLCRSVLGEPRYASAALESTDVFAIPIVVLTDFLKAYPLAIEHLQQIATQRVEYYNKMEEYARAKNKNCILELREGALLEKRKTRQLAEL